MTKQNLEDLRMEIEHAALLRFGANYETAVLTMYRFIAEKLLTGDPEELVIATAISALRNWIAEAKEVQP